MKKIFLAICLSFMLMFAGNAMAGGFGIGTIDVDVLAGSGQFDVDGKLIPNGGALGVTGSAGVVAGKINGFVFNGTVGGKFDPATAGGTGATNAYRFNPYLGDKSIGVGSSSIAHAQTGAYMRLGVNPGNWGFGEVHGAVGGFAAQGTLNGSALIQSPKYFDTKGFTGGIAGQGSVGGFVGGAVAVSGPDFGRRCNKVDSKAGAELDANIDMTGSSYSESYRFVDWGLGYKTEGMGTYVGANTEITSHGYSNNWNKGLGWSSVSVEGGWKAAGGATTKTVQYGAGGVGMASANGFYAGSGALNANYVGSASGFSRTQITTFNGMNGSIISSSAGMRVTSQVSSNMPN